MSDRTIRRLVRCEDVDFSLRTIQLVADELGVDLLAELRRAA